MESTTILRTPKRVVLAAVDNRNNGSPISPMANLKLLTKVATSYMDENTNDLWTYSNKFTKRTPVKNQRQLRSLGFICKKFLDLYNLEISVGHSKQISLGNLTTVLDIEKRRVYDIINIIASLRYASKVCKDKYSWFGNQNLIPTLCELRSLALQRNYHLLLQRCLNNNFSTDINCDNNLDSINSQPIENFAKKDESQFFDDNRIGALCQKSMMLFLVAPKGEPLNFKIISHIILQKDIQDKTGMRRLYDISNVLEALGLIRRCDSKLIKRPAFIYSGPELPGKDSDLEAIQGSRLTDIEHLSDTSSDSYELRRSMFELVSTEIQELEKIEPKNVILQPSTVTAKKQLFPDMNMKPCAGFIKASQSFKFTTNGLIRITSQANTITESVKLETQPVLTPAFPPRKQLTKFSPVFKSLSDDQQPHNTIIRINRISRPQPIYKLSNMPNSIQNGGIYKAVKQGNIINLVQLRSGQ